MDSVQVGEAVKLRVFLIPYFATGHIIPTFELARLIASRPGVEPTIFLSPANAAIIRPALAACPPAAAVRLHLFPFPADEVCLLPGQENIASVPASESWKLDKAVSLVRDSLDPVIRAQPGPLALIADFHYWWALLTAADLGIPCVTLGAIGVFPQVVFRCLAMHEGDTDDEKGDHDHFVVPGLPGMPIEMAKSELPRHLTAGGDEGEFAGILGKLMEVRHLRFGRVVNTFYELEPDYCEFYRRMEGRAWFVGPVALAVGETEGRGGAAEGGDRCMAWLDCQAPGSVVFVCFGSWCHFAEEQLSEMALGLEASGRPFLWVVRGGAEEWMPEGWEERVKEGSGMVVRGWAPQVAILGHKAVGVFMTHCGWNSVLEATSAGVPVLTWPLVFEQFINERLVTEVMKAGVRVWKGRRSVVEEEKTVVPAEAIAKAVAEFMKDGGGVEESRRRAREYAQLAKAAVADGGSSHRDLNCMVDELVEAAQKRAGTA